MTREFWEIAGSIVDKADVFRRMETGKPTPRHPCEDLLVILIIEALERERLAARSDGELPPVDGGKA